MYKLSVIIPCYNSEKTIDETISCILNQTMKEIFIICIDDFSKDSTYEKLKKYSNYENVKIVKNDYNKGAAYCRNLGIKLANTEFIGFIDSDDKVDTNYYEELFKAQRNHDADIVVTDIVSINSENDKYYAKCCNGELSKYNIIDNGMSASSCNKIIRKCLIEKYLYPEGIINEDISTIIPIVLNSNKIEYTDKVAYYYIQRKDSVQHGNLTSKKLQLFKAVDICLRRIRYLNDYYKYKDAILYHQILMFYFFVITNEYNNQNRLYILKKFFKKQKKYKLYKNKHLDEFLRLACEEDRLYYSSLINCLKNGKYKIANEIILKRQETKR